jgi:hypothetical protein
VENGSHVTASSATQSLRFSGFPSARYTSRKSGQFFHVVAKRSHCSPVEAGRTSREDVFFSAERGEVHFGGMQFVHFLLHGCACPLRLSTVAYRTKYRHPIWPP